MLSFYVCFGRICLVENVFWVASVFKTFNFEIWPQSLRQLPHLCFWKFDYAIVLSLLCAHLCNWLCYGIVSVLWLFVLGSVLLDFRNTQLGIWKLRVILASKRSNFENLIMPLIWFYFRCSVKLKIVLWNFFLQNSQFWNVAARGWSVRHFAILKRLSSFLPILYWVGPI